MIKGLLLIYHKFNLPTDCIRIIYDIIINHSANTIIYAWYRRIKYKMSLFANIITIPYNYSVYHQYIYYSPFDPFVAYNFYKASLVLTKYDDIDTWFNYFNTLNNFFKFVPIINFNDKCIKYSFYALTNFKKNIFYFY